MPTCKDCLHYGICVFHLKGDENQKCPHYFADVVPRSEIEELIMENESLAKTVNKASSLIRKLRNKVEKSQVEGTREIFEEIADNLSGLFDFFRQDGCIRESSAIMLAISEIAELKKKYVPDTNDGDKVSSGDICVVCGEPIPKERQVCSMCEVGQEFLKKKE